jgi:co-chaperonin GroES (HSP10)
MEKKEKIKGYIPCGNYVVLEAKKVPPKTTPNGIIVPDIGKERKDLYEAYIFAIGPEVKEVKFKVGDRVVFNQYDSKIVEKDGVQDKSIMAVY